MVGVLLLSFVAVALCAKFAAFGNNNLQTFIGGLAGHTVTLVSDAQLQTPGFLNTFKGFIYTRDGVSFGASLSAAAAANVVAFVNGRVVLFVGDFADDTSAQTLQLFTNAANFVGSGAGGGYIGEFNGAFSAFTSNSDGFRPLSFVPGSCSPITSSAADGNIVAGGTSPFSSQLLTGVAMLPYNGPGIEFGAPCSGVSPTFVVALFANTGAPAVVVRSFEICNDSIDNDGDGKIDCLDTDCCGTVPCPYPRAICPEICNDNIENDADGLADCRDTDCIGSASCPESQNCADGIDNDADGATDCADEDCCNFVACAQPPQISCPANRTVCAGSVLQYRVDISDNCRATKPQLFITSGISVGGVVPIGATTTSYTAIDSGGVSASCSFTVVGNLNGQQCDDDIAATSGDRCIDSQTLTKGIVSDCVGGCIANLVDLTGCPTGDNAAFQFSSDGAKVCTRLSVICDGSGERCKTTGVGLQKSITVGAVTIVGGGGGLVVPNAAFLLQIGGDYQISKTIDLDGSVVLVGVNNNDNSVISKIEIALQKCFVRLTFRNDGSVKVIGGSLSPLLAPIVKLLQ